MKSKILISVFFILTTCFSYSQVPTQQWLTVINDSSVTNDLINIGDWYSKFPFTLNQTGTKVAVTNNNGSEPTATVLNTSNGSIIYSNTHSINSNAKDLDFDNDDNLYTIHNGSNTGYIRKLSQSGSVINTTIINSNCQNNLLTIKNVNDKIFFYNKERSCNGLFYHTAHCFDSTSNQLWSNQSTDMDFYYGYDSRMLIDNLGNVIASSKKQSTQYQPNTYDIVLRKLNNNGQILWQTTYDFNSKMDILANANSLTVDSNNDIYFVDLNSSNWTNTTGRLVKLNGQTGQIVFQQQINTIMGNFNGSEPVSLVSVSNFIIASSIYKVDCFNSSNGSIIWSQTLTSGNNYIQNTSTKNDKIFVTTTNGTIVLDTLGNTLYNLTVTIPGSTVKHLQTISDTSGQIYIVGYKTTNNINKVFISKFSICSGIINAGQDLTICQGQSVTLNASGSSNYIWSDNIQNGISFTPQTTHTYSVSSTCSQDSVTIFVNETPSLTNAPDISVCRGSFVNLVGQNYFNQSNLNFNWSNNIQDGADFYPNSTNTYIVTANSINGCSNIDSVTVTVNYSTDTVINETTCTSYTLNGETYTESGFYTQVLTNSFGCDSIVSLKLSIITLPSTPVLTVVDGQISTQSQTEVGFQWFNCSDNLAIDGENDTTFTPSENGSYSVVVSNQCGSVQSDCITINTTINTTSVVNISSTQLNIFPNPTTDYIQIDGLSNKTQFRLFDSNGKLVLSGDLNDKEMIDLTNLSTGSYQLVLNNSNFRVIKL